MYCSVIKSVSFASCILSLMLPAWIGMDHRKTSLCSIQCKVQSIVTYHPYRSHGYFHRARTVISQNSDGTVILKEVLNPAADNTDAAQTKPADETRESAAAEETKPEEEETDTDPAAEFRPTVQEMQAMVSSAASMQIADHMGTLVTKTDDGIAVLKGEIKQDEYRGTNTDRKQAEFEDMQQQKNREMEFQFSMLGEAGSTMKTAADKESDTNALQTDTGKHFQVSGLNVPQDEQAAQQGFQVSIGIDNISAAYRFYK